MTDFTTAKTFRMPFGKFKGQQLDDVGITDRGLKYLDWLRGERKGKKEPLDLALACYLDDSQIANDLDRIVREGER